MAEVEITPVKAAPRGHLRVHASLPLAALDEQRCIRDQRVPADMIEMKVRVDDEVNLAGISVYGLQSCADFFARLKPDTEKASESFKRGRAGNPGATPYRTARVPWGARPEIPGPVRRYRPLPPPSDVRTRRS